MQLLQQNSAEDYVLRGFSQSEILDWTGVDVGYHGNAVKKQLAGIDRFAYKVLYVETYFTRQQILEVLEQYANGLDKESVLRSLGIAGANIVKLKQLFTELHFADEFKDADKRQRKSSMQKGMVAKFGTDNVFKLSEFQEKAADTREEKYGGRYTLSKESVLEEQARATFVANMQDSDYRQSVLVKREQTNLERYGNECVMCVPEIQQKVKATCLERYGVEHAMQTSEHREMVRQRMVENCEEYRMKSQNTCMERYGVPYYMQTKGARQKQSENIIEHLDDIQMKMQATMLDRYGVRYSYQMDKYRNNLMQYNREHKDEVIQKVQETNLERYGVPYYMQTDEARKYQSKRMLDKTVQNALCQARLEHHTFRSSSSEDLLYQLLVDVFGESDVQRQYMSDVYVFQCDFYIKSRDMYIELNASWTHNGHWYQDGSNDFDTVVYWQNKGTDYYEKAIETWTVRDVSKRQCAEQANLNYVVFWDAKLSDAKLWFALGCPDGQDWKEMYSWLPKRKLVCDFSYPNVLKNTDRSVVAAVKAVNGSVFYEHEMVLWHENAVVKHWGTLQARLYANRYQYLHKLPLELSNAEILRGLTVSGLYRGYSVFNNTGMNELIQKYNVKSMYDPCVGWGERLLTAGLNHIMYFGCDINVKLQHGYQKLIQHYGLQDCCVVCEDASKLDMRKHEHDCVFTCPPYENVEVYTDIGAENLSHDAFLDWWRQVVFLSVSSQTRVFAYQMNTRYVNDMNQVLLELGWTLCERIPVGDEAIHHFNRKHGNKVKKTWDEIQVFVR